MHFFYTDESGDTGKNLCDPSQPIFVMGGISVSDKKWNHTQEELTKIYENFFGGSVPDSFELHANQFLNKEGSGHFENISSEKRYQLAKDLLNLIVKRGHNIHFVSFDKKCIHNIDCGLSLDYNPSRPYLLGFDYLITYINWYTKKKLGQSARALMILDEKPEHHEAIIEVLHNRRFHGALSHRVKWIVDVTYSVDSKRNPMIQLSDLVVFCIRRFLEIEHGYKSFPKEAEKYYAECYNKIYSRVSRKTLVDRSEPELRRLNEYLQEVQCLPKSGWKTRYGVM